MSEIFSQEEREDLEGEFLSGASFDGDGLQLHILGKHAEVADNPKYGAREDGRGLKKGETWVYEFETQSGKKKIFRNGSSRLAAAMARANPSSGDLLHVTRTGEGTETMWHVKKV